MAEITCKNCHRHFDSELNDNNRCPYCGFNQDKEPTTPLRAKNIERQYAEAQRAKVAAAERERELAKTPHCPVCNSQNIIRLSTMNRVLSIAAFGLASSKIGKQYECKNCKHKW